jgi:DNA polymerase-3 subunit beta
MKFSVSSALLQRQLSAISGVIMSSPVVPILENFLFVLGDGKLVASASDLQTSITTEIEVDTQDSGSVAVPAKILLDTLKSLPEQPVTFSIDEENHSVEITSNTGHYKLAGENADEFPKIAQADSKLNITMSSDILGKAIGNTIFATSNDELRPAMTGIYIEFKEDHTLFVATDGHRLIRYKREDVVGGGDPMTMIIPKKSLGLLRSTLPNDPVEVHAEFSDSNAFFSFDDIKMVCRLIDERFPDYENAIPTDNPNVLTIDRVSLLNSLKRLAIYANKSTNQIRLKMTAAGTLQIFAEDLDFSNEANEALACDYQGDDLEIGFNAKFVIEMLSNLTAKEIKIEMSTPNKAGILKPTEKIDNGDILMLVMPVMLNTYA